MTDTDFRYVNFVLSLSRPVVNLNFMCFKPAARYVFFSGVYEGVFFTNIATSVNWLLDFFFILQTPHPPRISSV